MASKISYNGAIILNTNTGCYKAHNFNDYPKIYWKNNQFIASLIGDYILHQNNINN